jgi:hypothetical protein
MEEEKKPRLTTKGKVRKELTPEALDKLAQAREKQMLFGKRVL